MTVTGLEEILTDARTGNQTRNVTGALVYVDGVFFQIIEGDKDVVYKLMASIASDSRHHSVKVFYEAEVDVRAFESWSMAYLSPTAAADVEVGQDFRAPLRSRRLLANVNRGRIAHPGFSLAS